ATDARAALPVETTVASLRATPVVATPLGATRTQQVVQLRLRDRVEGRLAAPGSLQHLGVTRRHLGRRRVNSSTVQQPLDLLLLVRQRQRHHETGLPRTRSPPGAVQVVLVVCR